MAHNGSETGVGSLEDMGPVDYLVIEFPEPPVRENLPLLVESSGRIPVPALLAAFDGTEPTATTATPPR